MEGTSQDRLQEMPTHAAVLLAMAEPHLQCSSLWTERCLLYFADTIPINKRNYASFYRAYYQLASDIISNTLIEPDFSEQMRQDEYLLGLMLQARKIQSFNQIPSALKRNLLTTLLYYKNCNIISDDFVDLFHNPTFSKMASTFTISIIDKLPNHLLDDKVTAIRLIFSIGFERNLFRYLEKLSDALRGDQDILLLFAVKDTYSLQGGILNDIDDETQRNLREAVFGDRKDLRLAQCKNHYLNIHNIDISDKQQVISHLKNNGWSLIFFPEYQSDLDAVLAAVSNFGPSISYASECLRSNKLVCFNAISEGGPSVLKYLPKDSPSTITMNMAACIIDDSTRKQVCDYYIENCQLKSANMPARFFAHSRPANRGENIPKTLRNTTLEPG